MLGYDVALINQSDTEENAKVSVCRSAHDFRSSRDDDVAFNPTRNQRAANEGRFQPKIRAKT